MIHFANKINLWFITLAIDSSLNTAEVDMFDN